MTRFIFANLTFEIHTERGRGLVQVYSEPHATSQGKVEMNLAITWVLDYIIFDIRCFSKIIKVQYKFRQKIND